MVNEIFYSERDLQNIEEAEQEKLTSTAATTTTTTPAPVTTPKQVLRTMTKERRGMMEEPIFRPGNANDPQFMYRGRKKRSAPIPPFVQKPSRY